jgi:hypothetical protein
MAKKDDTVCSVVMNEMGKGDVRGGSTAELGHLMRRRDEMRPGLLLSIVV